MKRKINLSMSLLTVAVLFISSALVLAGCYEHFNTQIKNQVRSEAQIIAQSLNQSSDDAGYLYAFNVNNVQKRITLIDASGTVLYDSRLDSSAMENHLERLEVRMALKSGEGEAVRTSDSMGSEQFYYALRLDNGHIFRISNETRSIYQTFMDILPLIFRLLILLVIIALVVSSKLTKNIVAPINAIDLAKPDDSGVYDELAPFVSHISEQNARIMSQLEEITAQKNQINAVMENMREGLVILDKNATVLSINKNAAKLFAVKGASCLGKSLLNISRDIDVNECVSDSLAGNSRDINISVASRMYKLYCNPVYEQSEISGVILLIVDINDKYITEKIRREFSANVSHELKTPLTSISGYAEMIGNGIAKPDDVCDFAKKIQKESLRLLTLIDDIIKLSALDENTNDHSNFEAVNLKRLTHETVDILSKQITDKRITVKISADDVCINANSGMISELVYNLCENAIKYNVDGGSIDIKVYIDSAGNVFEVCDTGIGIEKEYHERIFERFFRVDKSHSKKTGGTGLGLSIVKHVAQYHKASLAVESEPGVGTTIKVTFPR